MNETAIIITMKNCVDYSRACVESIRTKYPYQLILVDDFSTDGTKDWCAEIYKKSDNITIIQDEDTESLAEKWNKALRIARKMGCKQALVCNNDILFSPSTIDVLVERLEHSRAIGENVGIVSAHNRRNDLLNNPKAILELSPPDSPTEADSPDFSCFLLDIAILDIVGFFDEGYVPCYFEDNDFHIRMAQHGIRAICTTGAPYFHYGSITQNSVEGGICHGPQFDANREYFRSKFGFIPGEAKYGETISSVLPITREI